MSAPYAVKCDECKTTIRTTMSERESFAGGRCEKCKALDTPIRTDAACQPEPIAAASTTASAAAYVVYRVATLQRYNEDRAWVAASRRARNAWLAENP